MALRDRIRKLEAAFVSVEGTGRRIPVLTAENMDPEAYLGGLITKGEAMPGDEVFVIHLVGVQPQLKIPGAP